MQILEWPTPTLKEPSVPCNPGDKSLIDLSHQMADTMYSAKGCGLAAPQVGINKRIIVVDCGKDGEYGKNPLILVNPEIIETSGEPVACGEGCLSLPGIEVEIVRSPKVKVRYLALDGKEQQIEADGLLGRCLQHEIDHLNGKTLMEICSPQARLKAIMDLQSSKQVPATFKFSPV